MGYSGPQPVHEWTGLAEFTAVFLLGSIGLVVVAIATGLAGINDP